MNESVAGGRFVSWVGFAFGSVMSIAANVLHTWLDDAVPSYASQAGAAVWPVALLLSVEVLSRVQWPDTWHWKAARYGGVGTVGACSAIISYGHVFDVLTAWGYGTVGALVGPLVLDGLMVISGFALLAPSASQTKSGRAETVGDASADRTRSEETPTTIGTTGGGDPVAQLIAAGVGRRRLSRELGVTEYEARQLLAQRTNGHRPDRDEVGSGE